MEDAIQIYKTPFSKEFSLLMSQIPKDASLVDEMNNKYGLSYGLEDINAWLNPEDSKHLFAYADVGEVKKVLTVLSHISQGYGYIDDDFMRLRAAVSDAVPEEKLQITRGEWAQMRQEMREQTAQGNPYEVLGTPQALEIDKLVK